MTPIEPHASDALVSLAEVAFESGLTPLDVVRASRTGDLETERVAGRLYVRRWRVDAFTAERRPVVAS